MGRALLAAVLLVAGPPVQDAAAHGGACYRGPPGVAPSSYSRRPRGVPPPPTAAPVRVVDSDGAPVTDAVFLSVPASLWWRASGGTDGLYAAPCGGEPVRYIVTAPGHTPALTPWLRSEGPSPPAGQATEYNPPRAPAMVELARGHAISGRVFSAGDASRVCVSVIPAAVRIPEAFAVMAKRNKWKDVALGARGEFAFSSLPAGRYSIVVATPERTLRVVRSVRAGIRGLAIGLDGEDLLPPPVESLRSDTGRARLHVTADGATSVHVAAWRRGESRPVAIAHGIDVALTVPLGEGLVIVVADPNGGVRALTGVDPASSRVALPPAPTRTVRGCVVRADGGTPVVRAVVLAVPHLLVPDTLFADARFRRQAVTGADGRFELKNVSGPVRLLAEAPGLVLRAAVPVGSARDDAGALRMVEERSP